MFFDCLADEVVDAQVLAWRARDAVAYSELYAPDAVVIMGTGEDETLTGRGAILDHYANAFIEMPADTNLETANRITSGEYVVDEVVMWGDGFAGETVVIYRVQSCLITRAEFLPWVNHEEGVAE